MKQKKTQRIIKHLFDISNGSCKITDDLIEEEKDTDMQTILTGLLMLSENIEYKKQQHIDSLVEKEILIREIHHRVKNNLQVITSLLSLQSGFIEDENTKSLFRYSQFRINSMAMIHELLYQSSELSKINYKDYITKLTSNLATSMKGSNNNVSVVIDIEDINLNIDTSIPLGLLVNEVITNSLKYGIKGDDKGEIKIQIKEKEYPTFLLTISDDGEGFTDITNFRNSNSLGLRLIHQLSRQLKGSIEKDNSQKGTAYIVPFQEIFQIS